MWRAQVVDYHRAGLVSITIPDLYRQSILREVQAVMDAQIGDDVLVVDLNPGARVHDWLVIGYVSELGRFGAPYPHTHPLGQVDGLVDALAGKAAVPGPWVNCTLSSYIVKDLTSSPELAVRTTPLGVQIKGRMRIATTIAMDVVAFTLPAGFAPSAPIIINTAAMGPPSSNYLATKAQFEVLTNGTVTARESIPTSTRMSFNGILFF